MEDVHIRQFCLEQAVRNSQTGDADSVVTAAEKFYAFMTNAVSPVPKSSIPDDEIPF